MKPARVPQTVVAPDCWGDLPWGELYRKALERQLNPWFTKMYGFHLLKIGNLSAEINCEACAVSHQVNVSAQGMPVQVQADPLHLPFADKSVDVCLLAHTLPWCTDPHRLLREADRVLIDDGWLVISGFNPISLMGLRKLVPVLRKTSPYNSRMFTLMRQLDWLSLLKSRILLQAYNNWLTPYLDKIVKLDIFLTSFLQIIILHNNSYKHAYYYYRCYYADSYDPDCSLGYIKPSLLTYSDHFILRINILSFKIYIF